MRKKYSRYVLYIILYVISYYMPMSENKLYLIEPMKSLFFYFPSI